MLTTAAGLVIALVALVLRHWLHARVREAGGVLNCESERLSPKLEPTPILEAIHPTGHVIQVGDGLGLHVTVGRHHHHFSSVATPGISAN